MPIGRFRHSYDFSSQQPSSNGMSDTFGRQLRKQTARAKEKLLEGLGKAKATQDDVFDQHASNLNKQSKSCERLQRDLKNYGNALKVLVQAQKTLRETIRDLYEPDWPDREHVCAMTQSLDIQWDDYEKIVNEQLMGSVNNYMAQFLDLKAKVAKRGRKLVDFDGARNNYSTVKASSKKGDDDPKVLKAAADLQQAETMYKELNKELVDTLPATYDSRITFFVDTLQTLFNAESTNHSECAKYNKTLVTQLDSLGNSFDRLRVPRPEQQFNDSTSSPISNGSGSGGGGGGLSQRQSITSSEGNSSSHRSSVQPAPSPTSPASYVNQRSDSPKVEPVLEETMKNQVYPSLSASPRQTAAAKEGQKAAVAAAAAAASAVQQSPKPKEKNPKLLGKPNTASERVSPNPFDENADRVSVNPFDEPDERQASPTAAADGQAANQSTDHRKILYKVRATHHYAAEDTDELTFDAGEVIAVLESREEDLLDEGWLLGVKQSDGLQGVFPANFTKQI